jgi:hypothetical protein
MPRVGFEPMTTVSERTKTFHAVHRATTVIGSVLLRLALCEILLYRTQVCCIEFACDVCDGSFSRCSSLYAADSSLIQ